MIICKNCNTEFNDGTFCPNCGLKAQVETHSPIAEETTPFENEVNDTSEFSQKVFTPPTENAYPQYQQPIKNPSVVALTIKQTFKVFKNFFSKNIVDAISVQYQERLSIWVILLALPALFSLISVSLHGTSAITDLLNATNNSYHIGGNNPFEILSSFIGVFILTFAFTLTTYFYVNTIKKKNIPFTGCLNLISACFIPVTLTSFARIFSGGISSTLSLIGLFMFILLLKEGIYSIMGKDKSFWAYVLLIVVSIAIFFIAGTLRLTFHF